MFNFEKRLDDYYSKRLVLYIKKYIVSFCYLDVKTYKYNGEYFVSIKKKKYNDNHWQMIFNCKTSESIEHWFNQIELQKDIRLIVDGYLKTN